MRQGGFSASVALVEPTVPGLFRSQRASWKKVVPEAYEFRCLSVISNKSVAVAQDGDPFRMLRFPQGCGWSESLPTRRPESCNALGNRSQSHS